MCWDDDELKYSLDLMNSFLLMFLYCSPCNYIVAQLYSSLLYSSAKCRY
jgi:hypothetical protein